MNTQGVALFQNMSQAFRLEKVLLAAGFTVKLIPTPRQFSSDCGIALVFPWDERGKIKNLIKTNALEVAGIEISDMR
jgi:hypothetical protein